MWFQRFTQLEYFIFLRRVTYYFIADISVLGTARLIQQLLLWLPLEILLKLLMIPSVGHMW